MPEDSCFANNFELLDQFVDTLMPATDPRSHAKPLRILIMKHTSWNLDSGGVFSNITIVGFNPLSIVKHMLQCIPKAHDIGPVSTWKWTHQPDDPSSDDADTNLIP
jgi:hypothetical protein